MRRWCVGIGDGVGEGRGELTSREVSDPFFVPTGYPPRPLPARHSLLSVDHCLDGLSFTRSHTRFAFARPLGPVRGRHCPRYGG